MALMFLRVYNTEDINAAIRGVTKTLFATGVGVESLLHHTLLVAADCCVLHLHHSFFSRHCPLIFSVDSIGRSAH